MDGQRKRIAARRALVMAGWLGALLPALLLGCQPAARAPVVTTAGSDTPEGQLKNVMRRLRYALRNARPSPGSGVVSRREAICRLIQPVDDSSTYTAEVTIKTSTQLASAEVARLAQASKSDPDGPAVDPKKIADAAETLERKVYKLTYKNKRWELTDPVEQLSATDQLCFQYALSDG